MWVNSRQRSDFLDGKGLSFKYDQHWSDREGETERQAALLGEHKVRLSPETLKSHEESMDALLFVMKIIIVKANTKLI